MIFLRQLSWPLNFLVKPLSRLLEIALCFWVYPQGAPQVDSLHRCAIAESDELYSAQITFATLGFEHAVVTDATLKDDLLAVTSHTDNVSDVHIIRIDVQNMQAEYLFKKNLNGEVACLSLCRIGGEMHVVAGLWWNNTVYLDFWCIPNGRHVKMVTIRSCKYFHDILLLSGQQGKRSWSPVLACPPSMSFHPVVNHQFPLY